MRERFLQALMRWASRRLGQPCGLRFVLPGGEVSDDELFRVLVALIVARREGE